jgi:hypothetical protein
MSGVIAIVIIASIVLLSFQNKPIPQVLSNYGGVIIGFFFGQFASFVKDALLPSSQSDNQNPQKSVSRKQEDA